MQENIKTTSGVMIQTPRGWFHVADMTRSEMESAGYGFHHESEDGKYLIMTDGVKAYAVLAKEEPVEEAAGSKIVFVITDGVLEEVYSSDPNIDISYYNIDTDQVYGDQRDALEEALTEDKKGLTPANVYYAAEKFYDDPRFDD